MRFLEISLSKMLVRYNQYRCVHLGITDSFFLVFYIIRIFEYYRYQVAIPNRCRCYQHELELMLTVH